jgi:hypothetical protein
MAILFLGSPDVTCGNPEGLSLDRSIVFVGPPGKGGLALVAGLLRKLSWEDFEDAVVIDPLGPTSSEHDAVLQRFSSGGSKDHGEGGQFLPGRSRSWGEDPGFLAGSPARKLSTKKIEPPPQGGTGKFLVGPGVVRGDVSEGDELLPERIEERRASRTGEEDALLISISYCAPVSPFPVGLHAGDLDLLYQR